MERPVLEQRPAMVRKPSLAKRLGMDRSPEVLQMMGEAGHAWLLLGDPGRAATVFQGLVALTPDDPAGWLGLAQASLEARDWKATEKYASEATRAAYATASTAALGYFLRGRASLGLRKTADAMKYFDRAAGLEPKGSAGDQARAALQKIGKLIDGGVGRNEEK